MDEATHKAVKQRGAMRLICTTSFPLRKYRFSEKWDLVTCASCLQLRPLDRRQRVVRLTDADVSEIRSLAEFGALRVDIAKRFGVTEAHVSNILSGTRRGKGARRG